MTVARVSTESGSQLGMGTSFISIGVGNCSCSYGYVRDEFPIVERVVLVSSGFGLEKAANGVPCDMHLLLSTRGRAGVGARMPQTFGASCSARRKAPLSRPWASGAPFAASIVKSLLVLLYFGINDEGRSDGEDKGGQPRVQYYLG